MKYERSNDPNKFTEAEFRKLVRNAKPSRNKTGNRRAKHRKSGELELWNQRLNLLSR